MCVPTGYLATVSVLLDVMAERGCCFPSRRNLPTNSQCLPESVFRGAYLALIFPLYGRCMYRSWICRWDSSSPMRCYGVVEKMMILTQYQTDFGVGTRSIADCVTCIGFGGKPGLGSCCDPRNDAICATMEPMDRLIDGLIA
ncbi:hypothetical protein F5144DRAFT_215140 [Chaetomium tenue]|uniref:Uncharacterized protein n=1 Tax=Chaetomium tenue TaxID=1854479 RepID=A0ACB7P5J0_9PEZI|nr:hypothetical protein F5144DRAFT_215140 [Chaetomium globosum]